MLGAVFTFCVSNGASEKECECGLWTVKGPGRVNFLAVKGPALALGIPSSALTLHVHDI